MIFHLTKEYLDSLTGPQISDACCELVKNCHFIKTDDGDTLQRIKDAVGEHASSTQRLVFGNANWLITGLEKRFMRMVKPDRSLPFEDFLWLVSESGFLFMENAYNEFEAYRYIAECYKNDPDFGNLFRNLKVALLNGRIKSMHAGGYKSLLPMKNHFHKCSKTSIANVNMKTVILLDRDTKDANTFDGNKNAIFKYFCGKEHDKIKDEDIYVLNQPNGGWHMWYKLEIENYFDDKSYIDCGMSPIDFSSVNRDYEKIDNNKIIGYEKSRIAEVAAKMSRERMEVGLQHFYCPEAGKNISEMQLFLLKLVRIM